MDGLWTAEFGSNVGVFGGGVAVFDNGKILGGDAGYFYVGDYKVQGKTFEARIEVTPFIKDYESVFKTVGRHLTLNLVGSLLDGDRATAQGYVQGMPNLEVGIKLTKRKSVK